MLLLKGGCAAYISIRSNHWIHFSSSPFKSLVKFASLPPHLPSLIFIHISSKVANDIISDVNTGSNSQYMLIFSGNFVSRIHTLFIFKRIVIILYPTNDDCVIEERTCPIHAKAISKRWSEIVQDFSLTCCTRWWLKHSLHRCTIVEGEGMWKGCDVSNMPSCLRICDV